jgi:arsenate reductase
MAKATFYWKPSCTTCRNARDYLGRLEIEVEERDINKRPPSREFLEKHIDEDRFLDFVSTRSPVFKERPLPRSKREAIDLMMEQSNLIKRPVLVVHRSKSEGSKVTFGFDKAAYDKAC